jgi:hypothetical protein
VLPGLRCPKSQPFLKRHRLCRTSPFLHARSFLIEEGGSATGVSSPIKATIRAVTGRVSSTGHGKASLKFKLLFKLLRELTVVVPLRPMIKRMHQQRFLSELWRVDAGARQGKCRHKKHNA